MRKVTLYVAYNNEQYVIALRQGEVESALGQAGGIVDIPQEQLGELVSEFALRYSMEETDEHFFLLCSFYRSLGDYNQRMALLRKVWHFLGIAIYNAQEGRITQEKFVKLCKTFFENLWLK